jgi:NAD(P)-dependent dehydrogenase (short-subunit alcohol dehydrogenase family)
MPDVSNRPVMLVTGAARGIGAAIARAAAPHYDVVVNYVASTDAATDVAGDIERAGGRALVHRADVGVEAEVVAMFRAVDHEFGRLDVLVNNAGIAGGYGRVDAVDATALAGLWAVNITGAFVCAREAVARMSTRLGGRGGSIVNISSKAAVLGGPDEWVHYAASKGAIDTMTTGLAKEVATEGIRVNAIRPGLIESDFHRHAAPGRLERMAPVIPMRRAGTADEVAGAVLWLASPAASYVTGAFIDVTGGR